jgi:hypothetical protein
MNKSLRATYLQNTQEIFGQAKGKRQKPCGFVLSAPANENKIIFGRLCIT